MCMRDTTVVVYAPENHMNNFPFENDFMEMGQHHIHNL